MRVDDVLAMMIDGMRALRDEVAELRRAIADTGLRLVGDGVARIAAPANEDARLDQWAIGEVADRIADRLIVEIGEKVAERAAARCADEVREQVEAILATAVADERPGVAGSQDRAPADHPAQETKRTAHAAAGSTRAGSLTGPATPSAPIPLRRPLLADQPAPGDRTPAKAAAAVARVRDVVDRAAEILARDPGRAWQSGELRAELGVEPRRWSRVAQDVVRDPRVRYSAGVYQAAGAEPVKLRRPGGPGTVPSGAVFGQRTGETAAVLARVLDAIEREPSRLWRAAELRGAVGGATEGVWDTVVRRLREHPAVVVLGEKGGRKYRAAQAREGKAKARTRGAA